METRRTFCNTTESEQHYTILTQGCSCPTMPNENDDGFVLQSSRLVLAVIGRIAALGQFMPLRRHNVPSLRHVQKPPGSVAEVHRRPCSKELRDGLNVFDIFASCPHSALNGLRRIRGTYPYALR